MATPTFSQLQSSPGNSLACLVSGQNPDGTAYTQPVALVTLAGAGLTVAGTSPAGGANVLVVCAGLAPFTSFATGSAIGFGLQQDGGCCHSNAAMVVTSSAGVTAGSVQLQGSLDGTNWYSIGTAVSTTTASTVFPPVQQVGAVRFVRASITATITGGTISALVAMSG